MQAKYPTLAPDKKIFEMFSYTIYTPWGGVNYDTTGISLSLLKEENYIRLQAKYLSSIYIWFKRGWTCSGVHS